MEEKNINTLDELAAYLKSITGFSQRQRYWIQESRGKINIMEDDRILFTAPIDAFIVAFFDDCGITLQAFNPILDKKKTP